MSYEGFGKFNPQMLADLEWQQKVSINTANGQYRGHTIGYTPENSVACCAIDNRMKMSQTESEFLNQVERVYKHRIGEI
jgi:hypothetical protein